ncbi:ubiquitin carboxyl-terminal hydrolase 14-like [Sitophilus oryzae]|uniref:Ubiquitin carboxyl-terminal hydrolase 14-like n=1 Tax=Sitophilus oryzae TaxID=7048 RepID=A0A6J2XGH4_SITOR|nr:ubiquitin carboxyl-terminal hydrolase 14-like [Sitophilus oryzae]
MNKKEYQRDPNNVDDSSESGDENQNNSECVHINKALDFTKVRKSVTKTGLLSDCEMCSKSPAEISVLSESDFDFHLWMCLKCGNQACGRFKNKHALKHYETPHSESHALCVNTTTWNVWCYECFDYVNASSKKKLLEVVEYLKNQEKTMYLDSNNVDDSSESGDENQNNSKCVHINKALDFTEVRKSVTKTGLLSDCEICSKSPAEISILSESDFDFHLWMCLKCGNQACGRFKNRHALKHYETPYSESHAVCVNTTTWNVWCYECCDYVNASSEKELLEVVQYLKKQEKTMDSQQAFLINQSEPDLKDVIRIVDEFETQLEDLRSQVNHLKACNNRLREGQSFEPLLKELHERERKKANFIIFGIDDRNSEDRPEDDKKTAQEIIKLSHQGSFVDTSTIRVHRLGKYFHGKNRPLRVICSSPDVASKVLHNTRSITIYKKYESISVRSDKTYAQLEEFRKVKQELDFRLDAGETNLKIIHRDGFPSIVTAKPNHLN